MYKRIMIEEMSMNGDDSTIDAEKIESYRRTRGSTKPGTTITMDSGTYIVLDISYEEFKTKYDKELMRGNAN